MTASQLAKAAGLKSLAIVVEMTGVSYQTLNNWHKNKPILFAVVLLGCKAKLVTPDRWNNRGEL